MESGFEGMRITRRGMVEVPGAAVAKLEAGMEMNLADEAREIMSRSRAIEVRLSEIASRLGCKGVEGRPEVPQPEMHSLSRALLCAMDAMDASALLLNAIEARIG